MPQSVPEHWFFSFNICDYLLETQLCLLTMKIATKRILISFTLNLGILVHTFKNKIYLFTAYS